MAHIMGMACPPDMRSLRGARGAVSVGQGYNRDRPGLAGDDVVQLLLDSPALQHACSLERKRDPVRPGQTWSIRTVQWMPATECLIENQHYFLDLSMPSRGIV